MPGHVLSPNNCLFAWGIRAPCNTRLLGPTRVHNPYVISIGSAVFAQFMSQCRQACWGMLFPQNCPFPWGHGPHIICGSLGPPDSASQMASVSVQPFLHSSQQKFPILYSGRPFSPKFPLPMAGSAPLSNTWFLGPSKPTNQMASWSVQPFLHRRPHRVPILYNGTPLPPLKIALSMGDLDPT